MDRRFIRPDVVGVVKLHRLPAATGEHQLGRLPMLSHWKLRQTIMVWWLSVSCLTPTISCNIKLRVYLTIIILFLSSIYEINKNIATQMGLEPEVILVLYWASIRRKPISYMNKSKRKEKSRRNSIVIIPTKTALVSRSNYGRPLMKWMQFWR